MRALTLSLLLLVGVQAAEVPVVDLAPVPAPSVAEAAAVATLKELKTAAARDPEVKRMKEAVEAAKVAYETKYREVLQADGRYASLVPSLPPEMRAQEEKRLSKQREGLVPGTGMP